VITLQEFYSNAWKWKIGQKETIFKRTNKLTIQELYETQWDTFFEQAMRNRLVMGGLRYGDIRDQNNWDYTGYLLFKLGMYKKTGNTEFLVDVANLALLEFKNGRHSNKHWSPVDTDKHNVKKK